eukprot:2173969-Rhodomonas_salina.2
MMILRVSRASSDLGHRKLQLSSSMAAQSATISIRPGRPSRPSCSEAAWCRGSYSIPDSRVGCAKAVT